MKQYEELFQLDKEISKFTIDTLNKDPQYNAEGDTVSRIEKKYQKIPKKNPPKNQSFFSRIFQFISNLI